MVITHKIQCFPNKTQESIINQTLSACRWIHNQYLAYNIENYKQGIPFTSAYDFSKLLTELKKNDIEYDWLNGISQKAVKEAVIDTYESFIKFFNKTKGFPKFKSKRRNPVTSYYLYPVTGKHKHNKIKLPLLGWMRIAHNSYVFHSHIINARMIKDNTNKYFIQLSREIEPYEKEVLSDPIGIDVGIKKFISIYRTNGDIYQIDSFLNNSRVLYYKRKINKLLQIVSKKAEINYGKLLNNYLDTHCGEEPDINIKNIMKGESYRTESIRRVRVKIKRYYKKLNNYKKTKIDKIVSILVKAKPEFIAIENLSITNMLTKIGNTSLHKYIQDSKFYYFKTHLINKCKEYNIKVHLANRYFASSKLCSYCGNKKKNLTLSDRIYKCDICGYECDRDINAAINLVYMKKKDYKIA